jgi:putative endonuclease
MFIVYILKSIPKNGYYVGQTSDLNRRISEHNSGHTKSTGSGIPWKVIWTEEYPNRSDAMKKENQIKKRGVSRFIQDLKQSKLVSELNYICKIFSGNY